MLGITVCVSSGRRRLVDGITDGHAHVDFPASSPFVLAVGGTLLRTGSRRSERAWKDGDGLRTDGGGSTGGGVSTRLARPSWQAGLDVAPVNPGQVEGRIAPDVAANASANTGYFTVSQGQAGITGGNQRLLAACGRRSWRGMNQQLAASGKRVGYLTPVLYGPGPDGKTPLGKQQGFNDIHTGNNITLRGRRLQVACRLRCRHGLGHAQGQGPAGRVGQGALIVAAHAAIRGPAASGAGPIAFRRRRGALRRARPGIAPPRCVRSWRSEAPRRRRSRRGVAIGRGSAWRMSVRRAGPGHALWGRALLRPQLRRAKVVPRKASFAAAAAGIYRPSNFVMTVMTAMKRPDTLPASRLPRIPDAAVRPRSMPASGRNCAS